MIYQMNIPDAGQEEEHGHVPGVHADDEPHRSPMPEFYGKVKKINPPLNGESGTDLKIILHHSFFSNIFF